MALSFSKSEWVSFKWILDISHFSSMHVGLKANLTDLSDKITPRLDWSWGEPITYEPVTPFTHFLYNKRQGLMHYGSEPDTIIQDSLKVFTWSNFIDIINSYRGGAAPRIATYYGQQLSDFISNPFFEVTGIEEPKEELKYDTFCHNCGAPALSLFSSRVCSKGCKNA